MDGEMKKLRVQISPRRHTRLFPFMKRVQFSGVGKGDKGSRQTSSVPPQGNTALGRAQMDSDGEYSAAFAATIAAATYAIAAREEKLAAQKKTIPVEPPTIAEPSIKRGESMKKPTGGSKISRWFSAKEFVEGDDEGPVNVSVRMPPKPKQSKPKATSSDQKVTQPLPLPLPPRMLDSSVSGKKASGSSSRSPEEKGSKRIGQEQPIQKAAPPAVRPATSYHSRRHGHGAAGLTAVAGTETKAEAWERAKLARIREEYEKMMDTISEWENEKKVKAKRQKEHKEIELDRKRAKVLSDYNQEMARINKIAGGARSMAEERKYDDEKKIKEKARKIRSTGERQPRTCACF